MNRRSFFKWLAGLSAAGAAAGSYAFVIEPGFLLRTQVYRLTPPNWTPGLKLRLVLLADPHIAEPYMSLARWKRIIGTANALEPDAHLLLGDYAVSHRFITRQVSAMEVAQAARGLTSPLGSYAIMGNHDWWSDRAAQKAGHGPTVGQKALEDAGIAVLENKALRLAKDGLPFWLSGTASIIALWKRGVGLQGLDDLPGTLAQVTDEAPVIHMAHEPDMFVNMPERVSLTLSGHTHGGQVRLLGYSPVVPSSYGNRYAYGHVEENGRHLVVSGGLGCSMLPVRLGMPPEIVLLELG
jgi:predicted MPP superfamily phosphohydrolase